MQTDIANVVDLQYTYSSGNLTKITRSSHGGMLQTYNPGYDVIRLVDVNGSTAAYYEYGPYGNAIQAAGSYVNFSVTAM